RTELNEHVARLNAQVGELATEVDLKRANLEDAAAALLAEQQKLAAEQRQRFALDQALIDAKKNTDQLIQDFQASLKQLLQAQSHLLAAQANAERDTSELRATLVKADALVTELRTQLAVMKVTAEKEVADQNMNWEIKLLRAIHALERQIADEKQQSET